MNASCDAAKCQALKGTLASAGGVALHRLAWSKLPSLPGYPRMSCATRMAAGSASTHSGAVT